ncbi:MAG: hypothetical protein SFT92_00450 [Rickettsiales bacterium]|nr:hypothetical protein [Rickettsiales bacterium]
MAKKHKQKEKPQASATTSSPDLGPLPTEAKRMYNLYVAVDACAELGGQPYKALTALKQLYDRSQRRKLVVVDTEQGVHEKANVAARHLLSALDDPSSQFGQFLHDHESWSQVIQTRTCRDFKKQLATEIFPKLVTPMIEAAEQISDEIRTKAFEICQERGIETIQGKSVHSPQDISLRLVRSDGNHYLFKDATLNEAADRVMASWREKMDNLPLLDKNNSRKDEKGFMLEMVKAMQIAKAYMHTMATQFQPEIAKQMGATPNALARETLHSAVLKASSQHYADMPFTHIPKVWETPEALQAIRMTSLWPWDQKPVLGNMAKDMLDKSHFNTGDRSYLDLYTGNLPTITDPKNSVFILLTHDAPLQNQMLECATGVNYHMARIKSDKKGEGKVKHPVYAYSTIHENLGLTKRKPEEYPLEAALAGSEFVEFLYKEALATFSSYISADERKELRTAIEANSPRHPNQVHTKLLKAISNLQEVDEGLCKALKHTVEEAHQLEHFVRRDIEDYGKAPDRYATRRQERVDMVPRLEEKRKANSGREPLIIL